jgi:hypothetical protein
MPILFDLYINCIFPELIRIRVPVLQQDVPGFPFADDTVIIGETEKHLLENLKEQLDGCCSKESRLTTRSLESW